MPSLLDRLRNMQEAPPIPASGEGRVSVPIHKRIEAVRANNLLPIDRICSLPIAGELSQQDLDDFNRQEVKPEAYAQGFRFFEVQAAAILAFRNHGGLFGPIGCGWGKTLVSLKIAQECYDLGITRVMLTVPPQVVGQLVYRDIPWARRRFRFTMPIWNMYGRTPGQRKAAVNGRKGLWIWPYSLLSMKDTTALLEALKPGCIIADEAHNLKAFQRSARAKRMAHFIRQYHPKFVALSGTMTAKSVQDYHHLLVWALGDKSPLPVERWMAEEWALALDASADAFGYHTVQTGPIMPLIAWARDHFPHMSEELRADLSGFRTAYRLRLTTAPGVVATADTEVGASLIVENHTVDGSEVKGWPILNELIDKVDKDWQTPSGDEINFAINKYKWLYELSAGFYNDQVWPSPERYAKLRKISLAEAESRQSREKEHHHALQDYNRVLRKWLELHYRPGLDTPHLVGVDMSNYGAKNVGQTLYQAWKAAKDLEFDDMVGREPVATRVCPYKILYACEWAKSLEAEGGLLWVQNLEIGVWLVEELLKRFPASRILHAHAGDPQNLAIIDPSNSKKLVVTSIQAHSIGKNLQHFHNQLFVQWPRPAALAEQTISRTHRTGQLVDEMIVKTCHSTEFDVLNFAATLNDSIYIHQSLGTRQKLVYAGYRPLPAVFPTSFLRARGMDTKYVLSDEQFNVLKSTLTKE